MLMYRAVPLRLLRSRYGMCCFVFGSRYCFAMPKSTTCITLRAGQRQGGSRENRERTRTICYLGPWATNEEVIRFDVTIDQVLLVDRLHTRDLPHASSSDARPATTQRAHATHHLPRSHAHRFDRELAPTHIEQVLEAGTQQVDDQDVVQTLLAEMVYLWNSDWPQPVSGHYTRHKTD